MKKSTGRLASKKKKEQAANILSIAVLILLGLIVMFPIYWIFRSSLMSNGELYAYPPAFTPPEWRFSNYTETLKVFDYWKFLGNTMTILVPSVIGAVITATMGGYAFARLRFRGKKILFMLCVGSMLLPSMVTLIPLFVVWAKLGLVNTYWPLILPHFCGGGAFNIFLIRQFVKTVPRELDEAATIDGASTFTQFMKITVPLISPTTFYLIIVRMIAVFKIFSSVNVFTMGSSITSNTSIVQEIYSSAFTQYEHGYASAQSVVLLGIILIITAINFWGQKKWVHY